MKLESGKLACDWCKDDQDKLRDEGGSLAFITKNNELICGKCREAYYANGKEKPNG